MFLLSVTIKLLNLRRKKKSRSITTENEDGYIKKKKADMRLVVKK